MPEKLNAQIDYDAVLEELYAKRGEIDISINTILLLKGSGSVVSPENLDAGVIKPIRNGAAIPSNAFFTMTLVDAAKKCIELKQARLTLQEIVAGLEQGGMPGQKPNTVYAALRRRESTVGDITRLDDQWGLKEWSSGISLGNTSKTSKKSKKKSSKKAAKKAAKSITAKTATTPKLVVVEPPPPEPSQAKQAKVKSPTIRQAAYEVLSKEGAPLHAKVLAERINKEYGKNTNLKALAGSLPDDGGQRFENIGNNTWALCAWSVEPKKATTAAATATA
ncbi:MAG TPA: winged helix-turn-helix domain-containing protein [Pyrinomonadaceae bacterium]|jgi:DNA-directed RNA polymerase delta subunit